MSRIKQIRSNTKYDEIIIPDNSLFKENGVLCYSDEYRETIETIKNNVRNTTCYKTTPSLDLYFTRTAIKDPSKREIGEKSIEKLFKKRGFQVFSPEKLLLEKQISLLMKCKRFAATEGSCSHASVFCNPSAEVIILRKANYVNSYSAMINDFIGYQTVFVDVNHSVMTNKEAPMVGPFYLYVSKELSRFMDINYIHRPLFSRPSYLNYYLTNSIKKHHHLTKILLVLKNRFRGQKWAHPIKGDL